MSKTQQLFKLRELRTWMLRVRLKLICNTTCVQKMWAAVYDAHLLQGKKENIVDKKNNANA